MTTSLVPLAVRRDSTEVNEPFHGDELGRKAIANTLTAYIDRLQAGAVIAVTAPWGEGKTWFGRHWHAQLKSVQPTGAQTSAPHRTAYIDAFKSDYLEDPFILIASELSELLDPKGNSRPLLKKAIEAGKRIVPALAKVAIGYVGGQAIDGLSSLGDELKEGLKSAAEKAAEQSEKWMENRFKDQADHARSVEGFRIALTEAAGNSDKPVIVFIDELDRCKPTFSVLLIERLKHFFDVPNLVFVLLINRTQLERSIEAFYGVGTDGPSYLKKFVNLWFTLPAPVKPDFSDNDRIERFIANTLNEYRLTSVAREAIERFTKDCTVWAHVFNMSLRDIEQMCTLFVLSKFDTRGLCTYLMALKVMHPKIFAKIRKSESDAHKEAIKLLIAGKPNAEQNAEDYPDNIIIAIRELHNAVAAGQEQHPIDGQFSKHWRYLVGPQAFSSRNRALLKISEIIDLPIFSN